MAAIHLYEVKVTFGNVHIPAEQAVAGVVGGLIKGRAGEGIYSRPGASSEPPRMSALDGVNLEIHHGETMGILGPSGCGKSTLLRAVAGLVPLNGGMITYDGQDMKDVPPGNRGIGIVFQNYALYPTMTSYDNLGFFFRLHHREAEIPERIREISRIMGIGFKQLLAKRPGWLSGGERQRVAVARCIARDPKLFLFDEPLSNLDAKLRIKTRVEIKRLITRFKITGIYVTHDQSEALALCDRIAIMSQGKIEQVGTADFLYTHPNSIMVAGFFGHPPMNLFEGVISEGFLNGEGFSIPLSGFADGRHLTVGIRAERLSLDPEGEISGEVSLIEPEPVGRTQLLYVETPKQRLAARVSGENPLRMGDRVRLRVDTAEIHPFDPRTGRRL